MAAVQSVVQTPRSRRHRTLLEGAGLRGHTGRERVAVSESGRPGGRAPHRVSAGLGSPAAGRSLRQSGRLWVLSLPPPLLTGSGNAADPVEPVTAGAVADEQVGDVFARDRIDD